MTNDEFLEGLASARNREEAARVYAQALDMLGAGTIRWVNANTYLAARWSESGMKYIRWRAWAIHDRKVLDKSTE